MWSQDKEKARVGNKIKQGVLLSYKVSCSIQFAWVGRFLDLSFLVAKARRTNVFINQIPRAHKGKHTRKHTHKTSCSKKEEKKQKEKEEEGKNEEEEEQQQQ